MKENYLINIEGRMEAEGESDSIRLMTRGSFVRRGGKYFISYRETEATGYQDNITTVKVEEDRRVSMLRVGSATSQLVVEVGRRHVCHYDTGYGVLNLGVAADEICTELGEHGGHVSFSYTLDTSNSTLSRNRVDITVQEAD